MGHGRDSELFPRTSWRILGGFSAASVAGFAFYSGCAKNHPAPVPAPKPPVGTVINDRSDVDPARVAGTTQNLFLAGSIYPVEVKTVRKDHDVRFGLISHGEVFETEKYRDEPSQFSLLETAEEQYNPPLPLLKFPMRVGDTWNWSGAVTTGDIARPSSATVTTAWDSSVVLQQSQVSHRTIRVTVELHLAANPNGSPLKRDLQFWFEPKRGIVQREFGSASHRQAIGGG